MIASLLRFGLSGVAAALMDLLVLVTLHGGLGLTLPAAVATAYLVAFAVNFSLNRRWVFQDRSSTWSGSMVRYLVLVLANLLVNTVAVPVLAEAGLDYRLAKALVLAVMFGVNFVVQRRWVFGGAESVRSAASTPR
jgi:putative flippase GtrA